MKKFNVYCFFDIELNQYTNPIVLRNDVEAKKFFKYQINNDTFNGCPVKMYCIGRFDRDNKVTPIDIFPLPEEIYLDDSVDDSPDDEVKI